MKPPIPCATRERGAALIVALIFLIILTLLGTSGTMNNALQERMAGNTRNRDLAFQAAEYALTDAEDVLGDTVSAVGAYINAAIEIDKGKDTTLPTRPSGLLLDGEKHANDFVYWRDTFDWGSGQPIAVNDVVDSVETQPSYIIEQMPSATETDPLDASKTITYHYYRVTAQGIGGVSDAVVILQTMYRFK